MRPQVQNCFETPSVLALRCMSNRFEAPRNSRHEASFSSACAKNRHCLTVAELVDWTWNNPILEQEDLWFALLDVESRPQFRRVVICDAEKSGGQVTESKL
ncbi:hypothetical protein AVEN_191387-1 [Araneus ventricosus]|uniref:Uncharacterized protein n=1 Tax=Araneus ventricosus TaxID=182803 RepID=A0A4Y2M7P4_ARAVE|nr:hypothetical protein AVEN_191387-1 [Araneus ventricosus]